MTPHPGDAHCIPVRAGLVFIGGLAGFRKLYCSISDCGHQTSLLVFGSDRPALDHRWGEVRDTDLAGLVTSGGLAGQPYFSCGGSGWGKAREKYYDIWMVGGQLAIPSKGGQEVMHLRYCWEMKSVVQKVDVTEKQWEEHQI